MPITGPADCERGAFAVATAAGAQMGRSSNNAVSGMDFAFLGPIRSLTHN